MNDERMAEIGENVGLTPEQAAPQYVKVLLYRVVEAEQLVARAGSALADRAQQGIDQALEHHTWTTVDGAPLHATAELAARFDYALVRLAERRTALAIVAEAITGSR